MRLASQLSIAVLGALTFASAAEAGVRPVAGRQAAPRCTTVAPAAPLNAVCGMMSAYMSSRRIFDEPANRLRRDYGFRPATISEPGRAAWKRLLKQAEAPLRPYEEICSPRRAALRARVPAGDQEVLRRLCTTVQHYGNLYLVMYAIISKHRAATVQEAADLTALTTGISRNFPLLIRALRANPTLAGPV